MPILELTSRERSALRSAAHPLRPVVLIGDNGLTGPVLKEIDRALAAHGLIKVRAGGNARDERETMLAAICETLSCAPVHHLGKMLILFRPLPGNVAPAACAEDGSRPRRKPSEPHTPKKLAAEGKSLAKPRPAPARKTAKPADPHARATLNKAGRPARPGTQKAASAAPHGIPRRAGSALSLRAGARSGVQRAAATRRRAAKTTKT